MNNCCEKCKCLHCHLDRKEGCHIDCHCHSKEEVKTCLNINCPERTGGECTAGYCRPVDEPMPIEGKDYTITTASSSESWVEKYNIFVKDLREVSDFSEYTASKVEDFIKNTIIPAEVERGRKEVFKILDTIDQADHGQYENGIRSGIKSELIRLFTH